MKKRFFALLFSAVLCAPAVTFAHDLLPKQIVEYLSAYPGATPEEIRSYARTLDPEVAAKFTSREDVIRVLRNRDTSVWDNMRDFLVLGVGHILSGADHILFVLSMLLVFGSVWELLKLTTTFTVAHSITLFLAGAGIITLSPRISEPLIAFSIAFMAIATVFFRGRLIGENRGKIATVFFFGLFHGLGFAGLLKEIAIPEDKFISSLFSFNIGIEIGQLVIISLALPLIFYCRKKVWYPKFIKLFALCISVLALYWVTVRILGMG